MLFICAIGLTCSAAGAIQIVYDYDYKKMIEMTLNFNFKSLGWQKLQFSHNLVVHKKCGRLYFTVTLANLN